MGRVIYLAPLLWDPVAPDSVHIVAGSLRTVTLTLPAIHPVLSSFLLALGELQFPGSFAVDTPM